MPGAQSSADTTVATRRIGRAIIGAGGFFLLWAPLVTLALMGGTYILECLNALADPGTGFVYHFEGRKGPVTIRAKSYGVAIFSGNLVANDVTLFAPSDEVVASADEVTLRLPNYSGGDPRFLAARISGVRGSLIRDEEGRFLFLDLLPPQKEEPSKLAYRVDIEDAAIQVIDRTRSGIWTRKIRLPDIRIDGIGDRWRATGRVVQEPGGVADVTLISDPGSEIGIQGSFREFDAAPWLGPVRRTRETENWDLLKDLAADRLVVTGPLALRIPAEGPAQIEGRVEATGYRVRHRELFAQNAKLSAAFTNTGLNGRVDLAAPGGRVKFEGRIAWSPKVTARGQSEFHFERPESLPAPLRRNLPKEVSFRQARYNGAFAYDEARGVVLRGSARAESASWKEIQVADASAQLLVGRPRVSVREFAGAYKGTQIRGAGDANLETGALTAFASTEAVAIERFREETGLDRLRGVATLEASATGSLKAPVLELRARGFASAEIEAGKVSELGPFYALATYRAPILQIERIALVGPVGVATAAGTYNIESRNLDLSGSASGLDLAQLHSKLSGTAATTFRVTGSPEKFTASGPVEVYGLTIQDQPVPLLAAEIEVTPTHLTANNIRASRGAARLRGSASLDWETEALDGSYIAESIQLHDLLAEGNEGSLDLADGRLGGTLDRPVLSGTLSGNDLILQGILIDSARGEVRIEESLVEVTSAELGAGGGTIRASAEYDLESRSGSVAGEADGIPLNRFQPVLPPETGVEGRLFGKFTGTLAESRLQALSSEGSVEAFSVNRAFLGNGFFTLGSKGDVWSGRIEVGQPERFIQVPEFTYNQAERVIDAELLAFSLPIRDLYFASRPYFTRQPGDVEPQLELPEGLRDLFDRLQGSIDLGVRIQGSINDPNLDIKSLLIRDTTVDGEATGQLSASAKRTGRQWEIEKLEWTGGPGILDIRGKVQEGGDIALDGNLNNFEVQWLQRFVPIFSSVNGSGNLFFTVSGEAANPQIEASLEGSFFEDKMLAARIQALPEDQRPAEIEKARERQLKLVVYPITVSDGSISLDGQFFYRGFTGTLVGHVPFRYPFTFPNDEEMEISLRVPERNLDDLKPFFDRLDVARTEGSVWADVKLSGTFDDAEFSGGLNLKADSLAFEDVDTVFRGVMADMGLSANTIRLNLLAQSDRGGQIRGQGRIRIDDLAEVLRDPSEKFLDSPIEASINLTDARIAERNLPLDEAGESTLSAEFVANGGIRVSGPLRSPLISTFVPLSLEKVKGDIPSVLLVGGESAKALFEPRFQVAYVVGTRDEPAELRAAASVLNLWGTGFVTGSLEDLKANADLRVRSGHIRLPNARIALQEGGTVVLRYDGSAFDPELRLDVDIEGRTALSTIRFGTLIERYDIYLELKGNLLNAEQQTIIARSDPPDLSQERIMNLLGQIELVERISSNLIGGQQRRELEQALTGLALPYVFDPFTEELARQLGLEYLSLDYGPLGQTSVTAAKWLGKGFLIQGRREVSTPIDRVPDYDLRLTYRPPRRIRQLRSLLFSIGIDQDRPWKISVEYGGRLPNSGTPNKESKIYIGKPPEVPSPPPGG